MVLVEVALQESDGKECCEQHLSAPHHLVHTGGHTQQPNVHEDGGDEVKE